MIKLKQAVVVEGKYDRIRLSSILDTIIVETGGFRVFSNDETVNMIKSLAKTRGIIIFTDSDFAGFRIRNFLNNKIKDGEIFNAYLPCVEGKEKRKSQSSKEGLLGVEGFKEDEIISALKNAGVIEIENSAEPKEKITKYDLYELGLSGKKDSSSKRNIILKKLNLPTHLSPNSLPEVLSTVISREDFIKLVNDSFQN